MSEHWKRYPLGDAFVHVLVLPDGVCRIWRGTFLVYDRGNVATKAIARARMEEAIAEAHP
jgi:hypothetical protein